MAVENPTAEPGGASITDRLETLLANEAAAPETAPEPAEVTPESDASEGADEPQYAISEVAKILGIDENALDVDDDGALKVKTKIDGREGAAKFVDLVKSYQLQGHVDAKAREVAAREAKFEQQTQAEIRRLAQLGQMAEQELNREFAAINWQALSRDDPAEYVAKRAELEERQNRLGNLFAQLSQADNQTKTTRMQATAQYLAEHVEGWQPGNDIDKALSKYASEIGITDTASVLLSSPAVAIALHKARLYDEGKTKSATVEKIVRAAPKFVKPGQPVSAQVKASENVRSLRENIRKSGGRTGVAEYLLATGKV